jgi:hypothetical protein
LREDMFARERRLRRLATKRGYVLVSPWGGESRGVGGLGTCYVLVPQNSGLSLDEVEAILPRMGRLSQASASVVEITAHDLVTFKQNRDLRAWPILGQCE